MECQRRVSATGQIIIRNKHIYLKKRVETYTFSLELHIGKNLIDLMSFYKKDVPKSNLFLCNLDDGNRIKNFGKKV